MWCAGCRDGLSWGRHWLVLGDRGSIGGQYKKRGVLLAFGTSGAAPVDVSGAAERFGQLLTSSGQALEKPAPPTDFGGFVVRLASNLDPVAIVHFKVLNQRFI